MKKEELLPIKRPLLRQGVDQIRPRRRQLIIHSPAAGQLALPALRGRAERKQRDDIPRVGVEHLLIGRVGRGADALPVPLVAAEVLDVVQHDVGRLAVELVVLAPAQRRDVRRDAGVDDEVFFPGVLVDGEAAEDLEAVAEVEFPGDGAQFRVQGGQGEGVLADVADGFVECCIRISIHSIFI